MNIFVFVGFIAFVGFISFIAFVGFIGFLCFLGFLCFMCYGFYWLGCLRFICFIGFICLFVLMYLIIQFAYFIYSPNLGLVTEEGNREQCKASGIRAVQSVRA